MADDRQLFAKAKQLDPAALQALHHQFYEPVARYIQFKVSDPYLAEDLSGEVFVRVLEGLRRGQTWRDSPRGWIMGIAHHVVVDYYRRQTRMPEVALSENLTAAETADPIHQAIQNERVRLLRRAIDHLTEDQREVITMRFIKGIGIQDIAEALGKTPGAVKGLQHRALRILAARLQSLNRDNRPE